MEIESCSWESDVDQDMESCLTEDLPESAECTTPPSWFDEAQFALTEEKYSNILSEVRKMRQCLSPLAGRGPSTPPGEEENAPPTRVEGVDFVPPTIVERNDMDTRVDRVHIFPPTIVEGGAWDPPIQLEDVDWELPTRVEGGGDITKDPMLEHAFNKIRRIDALLEVFEQREREARENTARLQLQNRREVRDESCPMLQSEVFLRHTEKFLKLFSEVIKEKKREKKEKQASKPPFDLEVIYEEPNCVEELEAPSPGDVIEHDECPSEKSAKPATNKGDDVNGEPPPDLTVVKKHGGSEDSKKKTTQKFIDRNIKLVTGSNKANKAVMTEEERKHLNELLKDLDQDEEEKKEKKYEPAKIADQSEGFVISLQKRKSLEGIDSRLELIGSSDRGSTKGREPYCLKQDQDRGWREQQMKQRLKEINQTLLTINDTINKDIEPLGEEEIRQLVKVCLGSLSSTSLNTDSTTSSSYYGTPYTSADSSSSHNNSVDHFNTPTGQSVGDLSSDRMYEMGGGFNSINHETLAELLEQARCQMPKFQYRHAQSVASSGAESAV